VQRAMLKIARIVALMVLAFVALSAIVGAVPMLAHPTGEPWAMPQSFLQHSPFHSYLIPGIILLVANGLLSLWVFGLTLRRHPSYGWWITAQGCVLLGWLMVEVAMLRLIAWPHYFYGAVAMGLIIPGVAIVRRGRQGASA
jgi:hypothetical protein